MPGGFSQPYRGQPRPKYPKPKKQVRNLSSEKQLRIFILGIIIMIVVLIVRALLLLYYAGHDNIILALLLGTPILFLFVFLAITDGLKSVNRFRKGYDIDISGEAKEADRERSEDINDQ